MEASYNAIVVDSGPMIRRTFKVSHDTRLVTVPAVWNELRDAAVRNYVQQFQIDTRSPSAASLKAVSDFSRLTGDYQSLSGADLQVLALVYELEQEGVGSMDHIRTTPKRIVGVGKIEALGNKEDGTERDDEDSEISEDEIDEDDNDAGEQDVNQEDRDDHQVEDPLPPGAKKTWALLVNPKEACRDIPVPSNETISAPFSQLSIEQEDDTNGGQFSDAEDDQLVSTNTAVVTDLESEFPSLTSARLVPYEGSDEEDRLAAKEKADQEKKQANLKPVANSGKLYNSFRKYGDLLKPTPKSKRPVKQPETREEEQSISLPPVEPVSNESHIIGGTAFAGQDDDVDDDGEGWVTCTKDIKAMKAVGALDPRNTPGDKYYQLPKELPGPPLSRRTACATTDFAMQNVLLQMGLELVDVDGIRVRKLKSWVTRCGACYKVYSSTENTGPLGKRLFCEHCGSDMMQRIAASIDGKTGRLRLHLSKKYKHNLRGTKFSLPKPGTGNRFQGDLLLREDQLLTGAWNQKVKMRSGGKARSAAQSIFGRDIASNVGCHSNAMTVDDIRVGFGRRNPNAVKGRERRGKKKKSSDKACGLRRY